MKDMKNSIFVSVRKSMKQCKLKEGLNNRQSCFIIFLVYPTPVNFSNNYLTYTFTPK